MELSIFQWYLIVINIAGFILFSLDRSKYKHTGEGLKPEAICALVTVAGGALGVFLAFLVWDRKFSSHNLLWTIYTIALLIVQVVLFFLVYGPAGNVLGAWASGVFEAHKVLFIYLAVINAVTFATFGIDKLQAVRGGTRVRELVLMGMSLVGGAAGGLVAMYAFHHKTQKKLFSIGLPIMLVAHVALLVFWFAR